MLVLPVFSGIYRWRYRSDLDGLQRVHVLQWTFNARDDFAGTDGAWYLDLYDAASNPLVLGTRISVGRDLWRRYRYRDGMPLGKLHVISRTGGEATSSNLGTDVLVQYERAS